MTSIRVLTAMIQLNFVLRSINVQNYNSGKIND